MFPLSLRPPAVEDMFEPRMLSFPKTYLPSYEPERRQGIEEEVEEEFEEVVEECGDRIARICGEEGH